MMDIYKTAVLYHFLHALGMLTVSVLPKTGTFPESGADTICWLLLAGILISSGSLYLLALTGTRALGAITPIGGVAEAARDFRACGPLAQRGLAALRPAETDLDSAAVVLAAIQA